MDATPDEHRLHHRGGECREGEVGEGARRGRREGALKSSRNQFRKHFEKIHLRLSGEEEARDAGEDRPPAPAAEGRGGGAAAPAAQPAARHRRGPRRRPGEHGQ